MARAVRRVLGTDRVVLVLGQADRLVRRSRMVTLGKRQLGADLLALRILLRR